jgi:hypothetical protein
MSIVGEIIESFCGKIYKSVWENLFEKPIGNWLKTNRCVPIYSSDGIYTEIIKSQVKLWHTNNVFNCEKGCFEKAAPKKADKFSKSINE